MPTVQGAIGGTVSTVRLFRMGAHTRTRAGFGPLPFTIVEAEFRRLSDAWGPIMVNGSGSAESPGVLDGPVMLIALRELLLDGATPYSTRDAILAELVERAQVRRGVWFIPPVGLLLPGLRPLEGKLAPRWWVDSVDDVQAELLAGLMAAIAAIRPRTERLASRLLTAAETHTRRMMRPDRVERRQRALTWEQLDDASAAEVSLHARRRPPGHAELLLAGAVAVGVLSRELAEVIAATYLDRTPAAVVAARYGMSVSALRTHRQRAVERLARWLQVISQAAPPDSS
jgi:DNA-directed RNA polymerase specialized sigma24 family protein